MGSHYSDDLARAVGYVVLEATDAEDSIGELIVLRTGMDEPDPSWWKSGAALAEALEAIGDPTLKPIVDEYRNLLPIRHHIVHGLWLEGANGNHLTMLRNKSTRRNPTRPSFNIGAGWSAGSLDEIAERFRVLDRMADDAISDAMGLQRSPGSLLPPRTEPAVLPDRNTSKGGMPGPSDG
ncbi:hypothetical protein [Nocardia wallacei]|uniref:hypothetical protein n=1 Tax=Nocardia wallacei TaxID=480035 RepID=UPI0024568F41|nr:hypothetical protein [Nocardia wallacei]